MQICHDPPPLYFEADNDRLGKLNLGKTFMCEPRIRIDSCEPGSISAHDDDDNDDHDFKD